MRTLRGHVEGGEGWVAGELHAEVVPYVRQTGRTRWASGARGRRARRYNEARALLRDAVAWLMRARNIRPLPKAPIRAHITVWTPRPSLCDADNLAKAVLDALSGVALPDDRLVYVLLAEKRRGGHRLRFRLETIRDPRPA